VCKSGGICPVKKKGKKMIMTEGILFRNHTNMKVGEVGLFIIRK
jgi:hypothetical protein